MSLSFWCECSGATRGPARDVCLRLFPLYQHRTEFGSSTSSFCWANCSASLLVWDADSRQCGCSRTAGDLLSVLPERLGKSVLPPANASRPPGANCQSASAPGGVDNCSPATP